MEEEDEQEGGSAEAVTEGAATPLTVSDSKNESETLRSDGKYTKAPKLYT